MFSRDFPSVLVLIGLDELKRPIVFCRLTGQLIALHYIAQSADSALLYPEVFAQPGDQ